MKIIKTLALGAGLGGLLLSAAYAEGLQGKVIGFSQIGSESGWRAAETSVTKQVAAEYGPKNVRCNSVHPGYILTPMMIAATDEHGGGAGEVIPLKRLADPKEVSQLVMFLASEESSFITGMEHVIDGGMTAC